jgi:hypothetical protein
LRLFAFDFKHVYAADRAGDGCGRRLELAIEVLILIIVGRGQTVRKVCDLPRDVGNGEQQCGTDANDDPVSLTHRREFSRARPVAVQLLCRASKADKFAKTV